MTLVFRNYVPKSETLRQSLAKTEGVPSREAEVLLNEAKKAARALPQGDAPALGGTKRANWDLKRDLEKRLKVLSKRTQTAIAELAEELSKEAEEGEGEDLS